ncbi:uncharacterized protein LOC121381681 [Gigantopelta aegis]|uniref:uncharacterized protein LOC121381681 n=1 Tax=Gigantopelta aegis TaxID=1735272 RepID=UPI001B88DFB7|nr:uncharacterized protein LOC121381681 [Gigantopelta aegis]
MVQKVYGMVPWLAKIPGIQCRDVKSRDNVSQDDDEDDQYIFDAKIGILQKVLRHSMSRFSLERLHRFLQNLLHLATLQESKSTNQNASREETSKHTPKDIHIKSTGQMRTILKKLLEDDKRSGLPADQIQILKSLRHFLADVSSIKRIKEHFDKGVFEYLKSIHHTLDRQSTVNSNSKKRKRLDNFDECDSGNFSQTDIDEQQLTPRSTKEGRASKEQLSHNQMGFSSASYIDGNMKDKLDITIKELEDVSNRWSRLLQDDDLDMNDFDLESHHEIVHLTGYSKFEPIFRLFPDIFAKCYKCIELSKQWWDILHEIYKDVPRRGKRITTSNDSAKITSECSVSRTGSTIDTDSHVAVDSLRGNPNKVGVSNIPKIRVIDTPEGDVRNNTSRSNTMSTSTPRSNYSVKHDDRNKSNDSFFADKHKSNASINNKESPISRKRGETFIPITNRQKSRSASFPLILLNGVAKTPTPKHLNKSHVPKTDVLQLNDGDQKRDSDDSTTAQIKVFTSETFTKLPDRNTREMKSRLKNINKFLLECQVQLQQYSSEQATMHSRENRLLTMSGIWGKLGQNLSEIIQKYNKIKHQQKELAQKFSYTIRGTSKYFDLREKVRRCEVKLHQYDKTIRLLRYQQAVVGQDYMLEMDLRPNFIREAGNLQQRVNETTHRLTELRFEKYSIERELGMVNEFTFHPSAASRYSPIKEVASDVLTPDFKCYDTPRSLFDHSLPKSGTSTRQGSVLSSVPPMATDIRDILSASGCSCKNADTQTVGRSPSKREGSSRYSSASRARGDSPKQPDDSVLSRAKASRNMITIDSLSSATKDKRKIKSPWPKSSANLRKYKKS